MIQRPIACLDERAAPSREALLSALREHQAALPRLQQLRDYMRRRHRIEGRVRKRGLPNNRLAHDLPTYIVRTASGFLLGEPVRYEGAQPALPAVLAAYARCDAPTVDHELAEAAAAYGRAVELCYADAEARARCCPLDPLRAFVVYADDALCAPLFGVHLEPRHDADGRDAGLRVSVYTARERLLYEGRSLDALALESRAPHYFGAVPMTEYWNNAGETGDFEGVLPLIDAYDALQSDRLNDKQQFTDAVLVLYGVAGLLEEEGRTAAERLREERTLCMPDNDARVEFLTKQLSESDTEVLKESLRADIHKLSFVPDLSDREFAGNASGVAMRYKLFGLTQLTRGKERWFREGLRARLRLFGAFLAAQGAPALDADAVTMTFTRPLLPEGEGDEA